MHKLEVCDAGVIFMPIYSSQITLKVLCTRLPFLIELKSIWWPHVVETCSRRTNTRGFYPTWTCILVVDEDRLCTFLCCKFWTY